MPLSRHAALLGLLVVTPLAAGLACSSDPAPHDADATTYIGQSIMGGVDDQVDNAVVGIVIFQGGVGMCSGTLIAPNLILTARHCVAETQPEVLCNSSTFGATYGANSFFITTDWNGPELAQMGNINGNWFQADKVMVSPDSSDVCGNDMALIRLEGAGVPASITAPLAPRVDEMVGAGEQYIAIGYGGTNDNGDGYGRRRILEDLFTKCVGNCPAYYVDNEHEWEGDHGICQGDSGGPALDLQRRVIGVTSRGIENCERPIYGSVFAWADWIKQNALEAAQAGGYDPAPWVTGGSTEPVPDAGTGGSGGEGGAAGAGGGTAGGGPALGQSGDPCDSPNDCDSALCVFENNLVQYCSQDCSAANPTCPPGFECAVDVGACFMNGGFGKTCASGADCRSGICVGDSSGAYCSQLCASDAECPQPAICAEDKGACFMPETAAPRDTSTTSSGCSVAGTLSDDPTKPIPWAVGVGLLGLGLAVRRRRSS